MKNKVPITSNSKIDSKFELGARGSKDGDDQTKQPGEANPNSRDYKETYLSSCNLVSINKLDDVALSCADSSKQSRLSTPQTGSQQRPHLSPLKKKISTSHSESLIFAPQTLTTSFTKTLPCPAAVCLYHPCGGSSDISRRSVETSA